MAFIQARRRGASLHFRRRIPRDLTSRFTSREIVRSIGRPTSGEARRILARLWSQSELVFMYVRQNPALSPDEIAKVTAAMIDRFDQVADDHIATLRPQSTSHPLDEPVQMAAKMAGAACVARDALERCDIDAALPLGQALSKTILGKTELSSVESGRLARGALEGVAHGAQGVSEKFALLAKRRPAKLTDLIVLSEGEADLVTTPELLAALRSLKVKESPTSLIDLAALDVLRDSGCDAAEMRVVQVRDRPEQPTACDPHVVASLQNADKPISGLWEDFLSHKLSGRHWRKEEVAASHSTLRLLVAFAGDRPARFYRADTMAAFRVMYQGLPAKYGQELPWKTIYEHEGPGAVVKKSAGLTIDRTTDKSWNKHHSRISQFFIYAGAAAADALPKGHANPTDGLFINIAKSALSWEQEWERRRAYTDFEIQNLFSSQKFLGAQSASRWRIPGKNVVRDHRFWLTLFAFLHGSRREEPALLKVRHVKGLGAGEIPYFDFYEKDLRPFLKDAGSPRELPIHQTFLDLGFLEARIHGRHPDERIFSDAETAAEIAGDASPHGQWFRQFRIFCGVDDPCLDLHSSRHTVFNRLKAAGVPIAHIEALIGHSTRERNSAFAHYDRPMRLQILKAALDQLVLPIDVDAINKAVARSDHSAAWPDLDAPNKWGRKKRT